MTEYYGSDLAWVHHTGYSHHVERTSAGIVQLLHESGIDAGARIIDVGCGSGLLARRLLAAGFVVTGVDASPAMIDIARSYVPDAEFEVVRLPIASQTRPAAMRVEYDAVVSTGHVLNYLDTRDEIAQALEELARVLRPGGALAIDLMTEAYAERGAARGFHTEVADDWAIVTRFSRPGPYRFDRAITVFRRTGVHWRRNDEYHRNVTFDPQEALRLLGDHGVDARELAAFGEEALPEGLIVLAGVRRL
jgi:SAM-dependent methyltransferase